MEVDSEAQEIRTDSPDLFQLQSSDSCEQMDESEQDAVQQTPLVVSTNQIEPELISTNEIVPQPISTNQISPKSAGKKDLTDYFTVLRKDAPTQLIQETTNNETVTVKEPVQAQKSEVGICVKALELWPRLKTRAESMGLKVHLYQEADITAEYDVEAIIQHAYYAKTVFYLVKWVGWSHDHNTWEPEYNLNCKAVLTRYKQKLEDRLRLEEADGAAINDISLVLKSNYKPASFRRALEENNKTLAEWEAYINSLDSAVTVVENKVDLTGPPTNFTYITEYRAGKDVTISNDPPMGCECSDNCKIKGGCCPDYAGAEFAYTATGRLRIEKGLPIYECNKKCPCGPECSNRVVQLGRKVPLCIFRTSGKGWGVRTIKKIKARTFVCLYIGEVITNDEAEERGKTYDAQGLTYLFDLDYSDGDNLYTVDAAKYGDISHFINHSCDPNLEVYGVWINNLDINLPQLALFSRRDIPEGEELTFDYLTASTIEQEEPRQLLKRIPCQCKSATCRRFVF